MTISAVTSASNTHTYPLQAAAASSQTAETTFSVDGTPPAGTSVQTADPAQQPGAVRHHHHHGHGGSGIASASGAMPQSAASGSVASALNILT